MTQTTFYDKYLPYAQQVQLHFGYNSPNLFLAQWAVETAWGTSSLCLDNYNLAGINFNNVACTQGPSGFASYATLDDFLTGYEYTLSLSYYTAVLAAKDGTLQEQATALGSSPWAASHYGSPPGIDLLNFAAELPSSDPTPIEDNMANWVPGWIAAYANEQWIIYPDGTRQGIDSPADLTAYENMGYVACSLSASQVGLLPLAGSSNSTVAVGTSAPMNVVLSGSLSGSFTGQATPTSAAVPASGSSANVSTSTATEVPSVIRLSDNTSTATTSDPTQSA